MSGQRFFDTTMLILFFFLGWTSIDPSGLAAQEEDGTVSIVVVHTSLTERDADLERILNRMVLIELRRSSVQGSTYDLTDRIASLNEKSDVRELLSLLQSKLPDGAELLILGLYEAQSTDFSIHYRLFNMNSLQEIASSSGSGEINIFLDRIVLHAVQELLSAGSEEIAQIEERTAMRSSGSEEKEAELESGHQEEDPLRAEKRRTTQSLSEDGVRYQTYLSSSYIFLTGKSKEQFSFGIDAQSSFYYRLVSPGGHALQLGVSTGYLRLFPAEDYKARYMRNFIPLAAGLRFTFQRQSQPIGYAEVLIGGAFRMDLDTTVAEVLSPVLPYLRFYGGIRALRFGDYSHLILHVSGFGLFNFYKEDSDDVLHVEMLSGIASGLYVSWRF